METLTFALIVLIATEASYLTYRALPRNRVEKQSMLVDTSVLIDGRVLPIARSGLITAPFIVPRSVIRELQYMADKADHDKRERARAGLDMIEQLKTIPGLNLTVIDDKSNETGVDERLIDLARAHGARLCTIDYNLNKAARAQGVTVVNINELAHALRIVHLPGEVVDIVLVQAGQAARQAVGYLDDGTMVVVDEGKGLIGQTVSAEVTRVLQTTAGKMMFARMVSDRKTRNDSQNHSKQAKPTSVQNRRGDRAASVSSEQDIPQTRRGSRIASVSSEQSAQLQSADAVTRPQEMAQRPTDVQITTDPRSSAPRSSRPSRNARRRRSPEDSLVDLANE